MSRTVELAEVIDARRSAASRPVRSRCAASSPFSTGSTPRRSPSWRRSSHANGRSTSALRPGVRRGLLGLCIGALALGRSPTAWGRRSAIIASTAVFGVFALLTATADGLPTLASYRLLTGIGLGGAMPKHSSPSPPNTRPRRSAPP